MSTIPSRLGLIGPSVMSLRNQTRPPDDILLSVPRFSIREEVPYDLPDEVHRMQDEGLLKIVRVDEDYGPGTKLLGALDGLGPADVLIVADDDNEYRDFVVEELASAVVDNNGAASFYVYESGGLRIGQGGDGFAMLGLHAQRCNGVIPLLREHPSIRLHDDYWISFFLARQSVTITDLRPKLLEHGVDLSYEQIHTVRGLLDEAGSQGRVRLNRECHRVLYRHAHPTLRMRLRLPGGYARAGLRRVRRLTGGASA